MAEVRAVRSNRGGPTRGDLSPDSVIFTSLFSSSSASVDQCSFSSDPLDLDSLSSQLSQHLAGRDESSSGPDLDPLSHSNKSVVRYSNSSLLCQKVEKAKVHREDNKVLLHLEDENEALGSARSSFSLALKECQERRSRSEALSKKLQRRRPASLDLNNSAANVVISSPKLGGMKKTSVSSHKSGNYPSPGTPNYSLHGSMGVNKGWSSERVLLPTNANRRQSGTMLLPLSNGRTLPSKWEDAERWIFSPVGGDRAGSGTTPSSSYQQPQRRPKSKSGPLGPAGMAYYSMYSPAGPMFEGRSSSSHMADSPFSAGVMMADGLSFHVKSGPSRAFSNMEPCIARSASVHGCTDLVCQTSLISSQEDKADDVRDAATTSSPQVSRRDMATQMSPDSCCHSSPRRSSFSPPTISILPIVEVQSYGSSKPEVRDVQIDDRVTVTRWSKKCRGRIPGKGSEEVTEWKLKSVEPCSSAWEVSQPVKSISKVRREEAKITAWENLQKAKAEAAIRELEMKLEKKRSSSMDKIMKKLRSAQKKAQQMRSAVSANQVVQVSNNNAVSFRRTRQMGSLSGCFTCHAF